MGGRLDGKRKTPRSHSFLHLTDSVRRPAVAYYPSQWSLKNMLISARTALGSQQTLPANHQKHSSITAKRDNCHENPRSVAAPSKLSARATIQWAGSYVRLPAPWSWPACLYDHPLSQPSFGRRLLSTYAPDHPSRTTSRK